MRTSPERRHQRHAALADVLYGGQVATLRVGVVAVEVAAEHQAALVRLAHVEMPGAEGHNARHEGLERFRYECLQHMAFDRQSQARHGGNARGIAGDRRTDFARPDRAPRGIDADDAAIFARVKPVTSQFWMMSTPRSLAARA